MHRFLPWLLLTLTIAPPASADEWWAWSFLEAYQQPLWTAGLFLANRADEHDGSHTQLLSPRFKYTAAPWLDLGLGLSTLSIESPTTQQRYTQLRPEFEVDPHAQLSDHWRLDSRNRLELRWNDDPDLPVHPRTRHRLQLGYTLPHPVGPISRLFASHEWIIDAHDGTWTENRLIPLGLTFKLTPKADLDCFYLLIKTKHNNAWKHEPVLGTYLRLRF